MPLLIEKSAFAPAAKSDGMRLLVTRYKPYGLGRKDYDVWLTDLAPSVATLRAFQSGELDWREFGARYRREIAPHRAVLKLLRHLSDEGRTITLLCSCETPERCHRRLLRDAIARA